MMNCYNCPFWDICTGLYCYMEKSEEDEWYR